MAIQFFGPDPNPHRTDSFAMSSFRSYSFDDEASLARDVASRWLERIAATDCAGTSHHVALSGGRIARDFLAAVAAGASQAAGRLQHVHFFWADERCVPPDHAHSNYRLAAQFLFEPLQIPASHIHRIRGELPPAEAAVLAGDELRATVPARAGAMPALDLVLLGMGEDGHVASLFPGGQASGEGAPRTYLAVRGPKPPPDRVTLTYNAMAAARDVWVLVAGAGKREVLQDSLAAGGTTPLARVIRDRSETLIFSTVWERV